MSNAHHVESDAFGTYDVLTEGDTRIMVRRTGAELVSLAKRRAHGSWTGFLYRDGETGPPESGWANHATVMGYFLHRLVDQKSPYRDAMVRGGNHGFLRGFAFGAPDYDVAAGSLTYRVAAAEVPKDEYPLRVALALTYRLDGGRLDVGFEFRNEEPELTAHVSFGLHPGFAVESVAEAEVLMSEGTYLRYWAPDNFLDGREDRLSFAGGPMPFAREDLPGSFLLGLAEISRAEFVVRDPAGGREVVLDYSSAPFVTIWSDLSPMICVEPCWGLPDSRPQRPFEEKIGIQRIAPGAIRRAGFSITPKLLS